MTKKNIVVFGGGNGSATVIVALKQNLDLFDISAIVSMSDSGGSSGRLRKEFGVLPPGDIMRAILAMSKYDYPLLKKIFFANRFSQKGRLNGHNLGNIFITLTKFYSNNFLKTLDAFSESLETVGKVIPNTLASTNLCAILSNGKIVKTEASLDEPKYDRTLKIKKVYLEPKVKANKEAIDVVLKADYIIFSPGSLYTSVVASFLPLGYFEAIKNSKAKLIFASGNAFHPRGETGPEDIKGAVEVLQSYLPRHLDIILHNNHKFTALDQKKYKEKKWGILKNNSNELKNYKVVNFDYERLGGGLDAIKLGKKLKEILK